MTIKEESKGREQSRFQFLVNRDGKESAIEWMKEAIKIYRRAVLDPVKYGMYKRRLAMSYLDCKRIVKEYS